MTASANTGSPTTSIDFSAEEGKSGLHRHIGPVGLLFSGVGSIIGSGWLLRMSRVPWNFGGGPLIVRPR